MVRIATNGRPRARALQSFTYEDPQLQYTDLSLTERNTILAFELANRGLVFDVYYKPDNITISCIFADPPYQFTPYITGDGVRFHGQVNLVQVT